ncbi:MAG: SBBP repeat-containing protein, partial [Candidatus Competibacter sp.]|nr:SBBP repeat-containing protein [Candidatus Competibacter sp.]
MNHYRLHTLLLHLLALSLLVFGLVGPSRADDPPPAAPERQPRLDAAYGRVPLHFEPNRGQTDPAVRFLARGPGYGLFLTSTEAVLSLRRGTPSAKTPSPLAGEGRGGATESPTPPAVLRLNLTGEQVNPEPPLVGQDALPGQSHYFRGNDPVRWQTHVPHYGKVAYRQVYPGIDWVLYGNPQRLEYDFVVAPGADPGLIRMRFDGAESMTLDDQGQLALKVEGGEVLQPRPVIYQIRDGERQSIAGGYVLGHDADGAPLVGFEVAAYDPDRPLIIDPTLVYSTYLGGSDFDEAYGIAVDSQGRAYVAGYTNSTDFPTANALQNTLKVSSDAFVARLSAAGDTFEYSTYLGGSGVDYGYGIAVDSQGRAYVAGHTDSTDFPTVNAVQSTPGGSFNPPRTYSDVFVARLSGAGDVLEYSTYLGGNNNDRGYAIAVDSTGRAYVTGYTSSANFPTANSLQAVLRGSMDAFVARFSPTGNALEYSTYLGGTGNNDSGTGVAVDSTGHAYVTGLTNSSSNFPTANPLQGTYGGGNWDAFVARLNPTGNTLEYSTYLGGNRYDSGAGIAVDSTGRAHVVGITSSPDFPTANAVQSALGGNDDIFVARLSAAGDVLEYSTYLGGNQDDEGTGIAVDSAGNTHVTGYAYSENFPTTNALQGTLLFGLDALVARLSSMGSTLEYATYLGCNGRNYGYGVAADNASNAYVTGFTACTDLPTTANAVQRTFGGNEDAFVAIISNSTPFVVAPLNDTGVAQFSDDASFTGANTDPAPAEPAGYPGQDPRFGRDAAAAAGVLPKVGDGAQGFDFTKLGADGAPLAIQNAAWDNAGSEASGTQWSCVRDNVTGLIWEVKTADGGLRDQNWTYTWYSPDPNANGGDAGVADTGAGVGSDNCFDNGRCDTHQYRTDVNQAALCGFTDWRLPTFQELLSIVDYGGTPPIDGAYFPNTITNGQYAFYWSSSVWAGGSNVAYALDFEFVWLDFIEKAAGSGSVGALYIGQPVRLVRGGQPPLAGTPSSRPGCLATIPESTPTSDFTLNSDGTAVHNKTGLMWMRCALGQTWDGSTCTGTETPHTWQEALQQAASLTFATYSDWRVPSSKELVSILELRCDSPSVNDSVFPNSPSTPFWSSSVEAGSPNLKWAVEFEYYGYFWDASATTTQSVRLVRGGQPFDNFDLLAATTSTVATIALADPNPTAAASVNWTVTFSDAVAGLSTGNFGLVPGGGVTGAAITGVTGSGTAWTVTASTGTGDGTLGLNMANATGLTPTVANVPFTGAVYTVNKTPPPVTVATIALADPSPTAAASVRWTVTFSAAVTGLGIGNFALASGGDVTGATITGVSGSGTIWTVTAGTGTGTGTLGLNLANATGLIPAVTNVPFTGAVYAVNKPPPTATVAAIALADPNPTAAASVRWTVTFSGAVAGLTASNLALVPGGGVTGAAISDVSGSGTIWTVTAGTGTGDGTLGLNLVDDTGLTPDLTNVPPPFVGPVYTLARSTPPVAGLLGVTWSGERFAAVGGGGA